jgi:hypothetical protein
MGSPNMRNNAPAAMSDAPAPASAGGTKERKRNRPPHRPSAKVKHVQVGVEEQRFLAQRGARSQRGGSVFSRTAVLSRQLTDAGGDRLQPRGDPGLRTAGAVACSFWQHLIRSWRQKSPRRNPWLVTLCLNRAPIKISEGPLRFRRRGR